MFAAPVVTAALLLAACGGGGVHSPGTIAAPAPTPTPTPVATPTPTPAPIPTPTPTGSVEDRASAAANNIKVDAAYAKELTGKGVTVAVIDTGIDQASAEFAGRISPDSRSFDSQIARCGTCAPETVHFSLDDIEGHGTETASIAVAARDGAGMHGVAPEATLLALKVAAPNLDDITATSLIRESDQADVTNIAPALTYAVDHGAFVVSLSLNAQPAVRPPPTTSDGRVAAAERWLGRFGGASPSTASIPPPGCCCARAVRCGSTGSPDRRG